MLRARYRRIIYFFWRILVSILFWDLLLPKIGLGKYSKSTRPERYRKIARNYRFMAVKMGGVLIKVGQFLSSRVDVLPVEVTAELSGLQDEVPSESIDRVRAVIETEFGTPLLDLFIEFEPIPLAAASLGQAHLAKVRISNEQGEIFNIKESESDHNIPVAYPVVVKVQRPGIENIIATDLAAIRTVGNWIKRYPPIRKRANVPNLIAEFSRTLYEEIDYLAEGRNAETFAMNFSQYSGVLVPKVVWTHTSKKVLTLQDVRGIKITDYDQITQAGIDRVEVASRLLDTYLKQIFEDGFFHADPHPGNLFIMPWPMNNEESQTVLAWKLTFIDFGMVGRMRPEIRDGLRELLIGVGLQDPSRVTKAYETLGILLPGADVSLLEKAQAAMFKRFWGKGMDELSNIRMDEVQDFAYEFREILYEMPFQLPQDLIFLGRAIGILSGMCSGLDPQINVFEHLGPFSKKIIAEEGKNNWGYWVNQAGDIAKKLVGLPFRMDSVFSKLERGEITIRDPQLSSELRKLERTLVKVIGAILFATFLYASIQFSDSDQTIVSWVFRIGALGCFIWLIIRK